MKLMPYLKLCIDKNGSDLFFTAQAPAQIKVEGELFPIGKTALSGDFIRELADSLLSHTQRERLQQQLELDLATEIGGLGRFRVNIFHQRGALAMVMRHVRSQIPRLDQIAGMPSALKDLITQKRGLILMVGATGSGKSTTLAAMIDHRNATQSGHILTIEDPIEFIHPNQRSIVNQREVGQDTISYERALKSALREAPDVILVGEVRSRETMDACIQLANTGHLAISTLHANNAYQALQRVVNLYSGSLQQQLHMDLSLTLRAIISQRLVRQHDGRRCAAVEVMLNTPFIQELILNGRPEQVRDAMEQSSDAGMQTFDHSLLGLYRQGVIPLEEALANADSRANLEARINFG